MSVVLRPTETDADKMWRYSTQVRVLLSRASQSSFRLGGRHVGNTLAFSEALVKGEKLVDGEDDSIHI